MTEKEKLQELRKMLIALQNETQTYYKLIERDKFYPSLIVYDFDCHVKKLIKKIDEK
ncbi:MAG: hypothetical protein IKU37_01465 [Candidatus Gastranaerophilales bacterium]|nr:hypothetical protein [Candidatus Gastranaerophilales bacterium]